MISLLQSIDRRLEQLNDKLSISENTTVYQNMKKQDSHESKQKTTDEAAATSEQAKEEVNVNDSGNKDSGNKNRFVEFMTKERHLSDIFPRE